MLPAKSVLAQLRDAAKKREASMASTASTTSNQKRARDDDSDNGSDSRKKKENVKDNTDLLEKSKEEETTSATQSQSTSSAKATTNKKQPLRTGSFTNTTMPATLNLPKTPEGCVKITSWNVSGLNASLKKGFKSYIDAEDADVICLQEHKVNQPTLNLVNPKVYPFSWWGFEDKKGYAGVAMFSKTKPISVTAGLPTHPDPKVTKGRVVTLEYPTTFLIGCYVPNAGQGLVRLKERMVWDVAMREWLLQLKKKEKQIIWTGDLNVCHKPIDLRNPTTNTKSAGFTKEERDGFSKILKDVDLVDTFREIQGEDESAGGQYSYFSYRFQCRVKGIGWRLDYFVTDREMMEKRVMESTIREECYGASDHVPIVLVVKGEL